MKKIFRMLIFSALAIYITSLWNKGFVISSNWKIIVQTAFILGIAYYLVVPICKLIFLPLNLLTLGLASIVIYFLVFYFALTKFTQININEWIFPGISFVGITINKTNVSYPLNVLLSAISVSTIINLLEILL